jgi:hypothetical protein
VVKRGPYGYCSSLNGNIKSIRTYLRLLRLVAGIILDQFNLLTPTKILTELTVLPILFKAPVYWPSSLLKHVCICIVHPIVPCLQEMFVAEQQNLKRKVAEGSSTRTSTLRGTCQATPHTSIAFCLEIICACQICKENKTWKKINQSPPPP